VSGPQGTAGSSRSRSPCGTSEAVASVRVRVNVQNPLIVAFGAFVIFLLALAFALVAYVALV
jgi:hypothetical protein